jgi:hypothetical protein
MRTSLRFNSNVGPKRLGSGSSDEYKDVVRNTRRDMDRVIDNYRRLVQHLELVSPEVLYDALQPTFQLSQEYCPIDTGKLKASGYLEITQFRGVPTVEIGYARGGDPEYAVNVHENLEWRHKAPTRAKWLQVALQEDAPQIQSRIVNSYRRVFE